jgi:cell division septation protein DedD
MVQLGAFSDPAGARQVASGVSDYGYSAHVSELVDGSRTLHRVRIGGFETRAQAEAVRSALMAHGYQPQVVSPE